MSDANDPMDGLVPFRERINELDDKLIDILARRLDVCAEVAVYKAEYGIAMMQPERVAIVKERCAVRASERGLNRELAFDLYDRIINEACNLETRIMDDGNPAKAS